MHLKRFFSEMTEKVRSSMAAMLMIIMIPMVVLLALLFQFYLRGQYMKYLETASIQTEYSVLAYDQERVNRAIRDMINFAGEMAVSKELHSAVGKAEKNGVIDLTLFDFLSGYDYPSYVIDVAVVGEDGLVRQYDRMMKSGFHTGRFWDASNMAKLSGIYSDTTNAIHQMRLLGRIQYPLCRIYPSQEKHPSRDNVKAFQLAVPILSPKDGIDRFPYVLVLSLGGDMFSSYLRDKETPKVKFTEKVLTDEDGVVLFGLQDSYLGKKVEDLSEDRSLVLEGKDLGYFGWKLYTMIDEGKLRSEINGIYGKGMVFYMALVLVYLAGVVWMIHMIIRPFSKIRSGIAKVREGNYKSRIRIDGKHELWKLAGEYNRMADRLEEKDRQVYENHRIAMQSLERQYEAEREALESQISAHFICNTLGIINYEAMDAGDEKVSLMIKKLSNILRYTFDQKSQEVFLAQEMSWVDQYLYLMKARYGDAFEYRVLVEDTNYDDWPCCKLMLQPFVENSILHGFSGKKSGGMINVTARPEGSIQLVTIADNGCGMDKADAELIMAILQGKKGDVLLPSGRGIGLRNVITRLRKFYGDTFSASMQTEPGKGTTFVLKLPLPERYRKAALEEEEEEEV